MVSINYETTNSLLNGMSMKLSKIVCEYISIVVPFLLILLPIHYIFDFTHDMILSIFLVTKAINIFVYLHASKTMIIWFLLHGCPVKWHCFFTCLSWNPKDLYWECFTIWIWSLNTFQSRNHFIWQNMKTTCTILLFSIYSCRHEDGISKARRHFYAGFFTISSRRTEPCNYLTDSLHIWHKCNPCVGHVSRTILR